MLMLIRRLHQGGCWYVESRKYVGHLHLEGQELNSCYIIKKLTDANYLTPREPNKLVS